MRAAMRYRLARPLSAGVALGCACAGIVAQQPIVAKPREAVLMTSAAQDADSKLFMATREVLVVRIGTAGAVMRTGGGVSILLEPGFGKAPSSSITSVWSILKPVADSKDPKPKPDPTMGCAAVAIGEYTLLTAAHCVKNGERIQAKALTGLPSVELTCHWHSDFRLVGKPEDSPFNVRKCSPVGICPPAIDLAHCSNPDKLKLPAGSPSTYKPDTGFMPPMQLVSARKCESEPPLRPWAANLEPIEIAASSPWGPLRNHWRPYDSLRDDGTSLSPTCASDSGAPIFDESGRVIGIHVAETDNSVSWAIALTKKLMDGLLKSSAVQAVPVQAVPVVCGVNGGQTRTLALKPACNQE